MAKNISKLTDVQLAKLIDQRWGSSDSIWDIVKKTYTLNTQDYENKSQWLTKIPVKMDKTQSNRIFPNMEAVINSLIARLPAINVIPGRKGQESKDLAFKLEKFYKKKYRDRNVKEIIRMGLRNLYFSRLLVIKPFWNPKINDFDFKAIDPRNVRFSRFARNEPETEFAIEEIEDNLCSLMDKFPKKKDELLKKYGCESEEDAYIRNPEVKYKEAWFGDYVICKLDNIILSKFENPYWDWDGMLVTEEEETQLNNDDEQGGVYGESRRELMNNIKLEQGNRRPPEPVLDEQGNPVQKEIEDGVEGEIPPNEGHSESISYREYNFNYFDQPRKPYIFATILNNENCPIGRTDFITLARPLQDSLNKRKQDIGRNCELVNGIIKVDSDVMDKDDATRLAFEAQGIIWGKGVVNGVQRETGAALPTMVFDDMQDSRNEIDNIMAASSAFRGEREGQETKAGRLALIEQSFLRLNELTQVVDYVNSEIFAWAYQLSKIKYTEKHYAKWIGEEEALEIIDLIQDDFETGSEIVVIPGRTLPEDSEFKYAQAQEDVLNGFISPVDYLTIANYDNPKEMARNAVMYKQNPMEAVGIGEEKMPLPFTPGTPTMEQIAQMTPPEIPPEQPPMM